MPRPCRWRGRCCGAKPSTRNAFAASRGGCSPGKSGRKVKAAQVTALMRQLATVTHAGIPLVQAFDLVADAVDGDGVRTLVKRIREDVASGFPLATALRRHPAHFDALLCNLVDAGEQSGALDEMLSRIATHGEKTRAIRGKVRRALTYPAAVIVIALAVTGLLLVKVVPQFEDMFASFGAELPAATQTVIALSEFAQASWVGILAGPRRHRRRHRLGATTVCATAPRHRPSLAEGTGGRADRRAFCGRRNRAPPSARRWTPACPWSRP